MRHSDSSPSIPPRFVAFARRYHPSTCGFAPSDARCCVHGLGLGEPVPAPRRSLRILVKIKLPTSGGYVVYSVQRILELEATLVGKYAAVAPVLDERSTESLAMLWGRCAGVGSDRAGAPDDSARPAGAGTWRPVHRASAPCGRGASAPRARAAGPSGRPGGVGRSADPGRPHVALALDVQESREAGRGAGAAGVAGQLDDGGPAPQPAGLPSAGATEAPRRHDAPRPQRPV